MVLQDYVEGYVYGGNNGGAFNMADNAAYRNEFEGIWVMIYKMSELQKIQIKAYCDKNKKTMLLD